MRRQINSRDTNLTRRNRCFFARRAGAVLLAALLVVCAQGNSPGFAQDQYFEYYSGYMKNLDTAFQFYLKGDYPSSLHYYKESLKTARLESDRLNANLGKQNCLVKLGNYQDAIELGQNSLKYDPNNMFFLGNIAFSYYSLKQYKPAIDYYKYQLEIDKDNLTALAGMSWAYYYDGDLKTALKYLKLRRDLDKESDEWKKIYRNVYREYNAFYASNYYTLLDYTTSSKDSGTGDTVLVTWLHNRLHRVDMAYSQLKIDYIDPTRERLAEKGLALSYTSLGEDHFTFTYKRISTNETVLDDANIYFASYENKNLAFEAAYSVYTQATALQAGFTYRYRKNRFSMNSTAATIRRGAIENLLPREDYTILSQDFTFDRYPWTFSTNYVLGDHSLMVRNMGFLPGNAPEEMSLQVGAKIMFSRDRFTFGYEYNWGRGDSMITGDRFKLAAHTLMVSFAF